MKKLVMLLLAVCLTAMCATAVSAEATHSVETDGNAVTITIGGSVDEEVTLQVKASDGSEPVYVDQTAADSDGAVFETELAVGAYTYRAYLNDADEYVEGTFKVEEAEEPPTSEPVDDATDPTDDETSDPTGGEVTDPTDEDPSAPSDSTENPTGTDSTEESPSTGETGDDDDGTSEPTEEASDPDAPDTGDRGLIVPLVLMLVSGSLLVLIIILKPKAGGKYARKD